MKQTRLLALLVCLALLLSACTGAQKPQTDPAPSQQGQAGTPTEPTEPAPAASEKQEQGVHVELAPLAEVAPAADYAQIQKTFSEYFNARAMNSGMLATGAMPADAPMATEAPAADEASAEGGRSVDDTGTNVQVAGVDECDRVKTDGTYLYILSDTGVQILRAAGAQTELVSDTPLTFPQIEDGYNYVSGLFLGQDRLAVIYTQNAWGTGEAGNWYETNQTHVLFYDTADKAAPQLVGDYAQDGSYQTARLSDGTIYLVTTQYYWGALEDDDPSICIPSVYRDGEGAKLLPGQIYICPNPESYAFTTVSAVDLASAAQKATLAFTDSTETVYMNRDNLYLCRSVNSEGTSEPYAENQYTVTDYTSRTQTEVKKLSLADGGLTLQATGLVDGDLINQFALDEKDGYLRLATTVHDWSYSIYKDENYGWENYLNYTSGSYNQMTVLDGELQEVGKADRLAEDEQIYSVRFIGDLGYMVTYKSIDPVFAIDLSDPAAPTVLSELKLPGVSDYLHPYGEGRLFGFGRAVNENAVSEGLQLNMFDVSDPKALKVLAQTTLDGRSYSAALYDHHAIVVSPEHNFIGFSVDDEDYLVYRFDGSAFAESGSFRLDYLPYDARGIVLGEALYLCSPGVTYAVDLNSLTVLAEVSNAVG